MRISVGEVLGAVVRRRAGCPKSEGGWSRHTRGRGAPPLCSRLGELPGPVPGSCRRVAGVRQFGASAAAHRTVTGLARCPRTTPCRAIDGTRGPRLAPDDSLPRARIRIDEKITHARTTRQDPGWRAVGEECARRTRPGAGGGDGTGGSRAGCRNPASSRGSERGAGGSRRDSRSRSSPGSRASWSLTRTARFQWHV